MSTEQFVNNAQTTLAAAITSTTSGSISITVQSATGFPTSGQFRIIIDSELMLVTAVSGTTWTATRPIEGTAGATHAIGAAVVQVLTAAVMTNLESAATTVLGNQSANTVFAGPSAGSAAAPTFRALVVADLPTGIPNANLANSSLTVTAGTGLSGGGAAALGGSVTLSAVALAAAGASHAAGYAPDPGATVHSPFYLLGDNAVWHAQTDLTQVGTLTSGTWNAAAIAPSYGGTGQTSLTAHNVLVGAGTSAVVLVSPSTSGFVLTSNGASSDPSFQAPAVPAAFTAAGTGHARGSVPDPGATAHSPAYLLGDDATFHNVFGASHSQTYNSALTTTTSTTLVDLDTLTLTSRGGDLLVTYSASAYVSNAGNIAYFELNLDSGASVGVVMTGGGSGGAANAIVPATFTWLFTGVAAGSHTVHVQWLSNTGGTINAVYRTLVVVELPAP